MKNTAPIASAGRIRFVLTILGIAFMVLGVYLVLLTPGEPEQVQPPPHAINQGTP
jgi:hypothetical protein